MIHEISIYWAQLAISASFNDVMYILVRRKFIHVLQMPQSTFFTEHFWQCDFNWDKRSNGKKKIVIYMTFGKQIVLIPDIAKEYDALYLCVENFLTVFK